MGTRNSTMVVIGGEYRVSQYGQWDGYIEAAGLGILEFLRNIIPDEEESFKEKVKRCHYATEEELTSLQAELDSMGHEAFYKKYPAWTRDTGFGILSLINDLPDGESLILQEDIDFVNDSLFCEYAYVIDMDKRMFEVYTGFTQERLSKEDRFYKETPPKGDYYPVKLHTAYSFDSLPTNEELQLIDKQDEDDD